MEDVSPERDHHATGLAESASESFCCGDHALCGNLGVVVPAGLVLVSTHSNVGIVERKLCEDLVVILLGCSLLRHAGLPLDSLTK